MMELMQLLLVLCLLLAQPLVHAGDAKPVPVARTRPDGYQHARTDEDLQLLYRTCLEPDFEPHRKQYTLPALATTVAAQQALKYYKHMSLVVMRQGALHIAKFAPNAQPSPTPKRMAAMQSAVANATKAGVVFPDCIFIMSTWDEPRCPNKYPAHCHAPVLSLIKQWSRSEGRGSSQFSDILVPFFNHMYEEVIDFPWELKQKKALMRGAIQNGMSATNTRLWLVKLSNSTPTSQWLDAGITNNLKKGITIPIVPQVSMPDHARWRYVVSADGFTASCRLGKALGINSVVLKEDTRWIEYYYRALTPGQHYISFTRESAAEVLEGLQGRADSELKAIAKEAQRFQQKYLSQHSKAVYLAKVLQKYVGLFAQGAQSKFAASLDATRLTDLAYLKEQLIAWGRPVNET